MDAYVKYAAAKTNLVDRVYVEIKRLVINFEIKPAHQIHIEGLSEHLNSSVTPVREALNRLLNEDLIRRHNGRGFQNRDIDRDEIANLLMLRGALVISAFYIFLDLKLGEELLEPPDGDKLDNWMDGVAHIPLYTAMINSSGNRELSRIYRNISCKMHFFWIIYAGSSAGAQNIAEYTDALKQALLSRNLVDFIHTVDAQVKVEVGALHDVIPEAYGFLFTGRTSPIQRCGIAGHVSPRNLGSARTRSVQRSATQ